MCLHNRLCNKSGFTIIELLVVLVITSAISSILLQSLHQVMRLHERFGTLLVDGQYELLHRDWLLQLMSGLAPDQIDGKYTFKGDAKKLSGLSFSVPGQSAGVLSPFSLAVSYQAANDQSSLYWSGSSNSITKNIPILQWAGNKAKFMYIDDKGEVFNDWPPLLNNTSPQVPPLILFEYGDNNSKNNIAVTTRSSGVTAILARTMLDSE
jgi:general secretion pathway protein J